MLGAYVRKVEKNTIQVKIIPEILEKVKLKKKKRERQGNEF